MTRTLLRSLAAIGALAALHLSISLMPQPPFSHAYNLVLFATNLYVLYAAALIMRSRTARALLWFVAGYVALFVLMVLLIDKKPLFILLVVVYSSVFGSPVLLGALGLFVLCFVLLQPYAFETFVPGVFIYSVLWRARRSASRFALLCLGGGLVALTAVLLPLLHLAFQDSVQTLWLTLSRPDVLAALGASLLSSTIATAAVVLFGVPLAWAMARVEFGGKRVVETLIDLPILVPQSVAGIAFLLLLGPGSPIGQALESAAGIQVSGSTLGLVIAQVFVAAPFLIKTAMTAFEAVPRQLELASRSLGSPPAATFWRISLPLASRGVLVGAALAWARAISEFGSVVLFASTPISAPVLVHTEFLRAGASESRPIAILLLLTCVWIFVVLQFGQTLMPFGFRANRRAGSPPVRAFPSPAWTAGLQAGRSVAGSGEGAQNTPAKNRGAP